VKNSHSPQRTSSDSTRSKRVEAIAAPTERISIVYADADDRKDP
jgi:hypothetical protein